MRKAIIYWICILVLVSVVSAAHYEKDVTQCETTYQTQDCLSDPVQRYACAWYGSPSASLYCDTESNLLATIPVEDATTVNSNYDDSLGGGYVFDCLYTTDDSCDNWFCQRNSTCYVTAKRKTKCVGGGTTSECDVCRSGYTSCDDNGDWKSLGPTPSDTCEDELESYSSSPCDKAAYGGGTSSWHTVYYETTTCNCRCDSSYLDCNSGGSETDGGDGDDGCEVHEGVTQRTGYSTNHTLYGSTCDTWVCDSGYLDFNGDNTGSDSDGCEITIGEACTSNSSIPGTCNSSYVDTGSADSDGDRCSCEETPVVNFQTSVRADYDSPLPLLWGSQYGSGYLINMTNGSELRFGVDNSGCVVFADGTTQCTSGGGSSANLTNVAYTNESNTFSENQTFSSNITVADTGFFGWLGRATNFITGLFVQDINLNGTMSGNGSINISGNIETSGNVTADYFVGNGSGLTDINGSNIQPDSIDGTELADTITLDAAMNVVGEDFSVNNSDLYVDVSEGTVGIGVSTPLSELTIKRGSPSSESGSTQDMLSVRGRADYNTDFRAARFVAERNAVSNNGGSTYGLNAFVYDYGSVNLTDTKNALVGQRAKVGKMASGGIIYSARAFSGEIDFKASGGITGTIKDARIYAAEPIDAVNAGTILNAYSFYGQAHQDSGGTINNATGIWLEGQTAGTESNRGIVLDGDGPGADIVFGDNQDANIYWDGSALVLNGSNIGAAGDLNVIGNVTADYFIGDGSQLTGINAGIWANVSGTATYDGDANVTGTLYANNISSNSPLQLQTGGTTRVFINDSTGNVGIGITNPSEKLNVSGNIGATGNITATYFFGNGSQLTSLTESQITNLQTYAINNTAGWILNFTEISSDDWTNVTITQAQINDLVHTVNGTNINVLDINASSATIHGDLNVTGTSYLGDVTLTSDNITVNGIVSKDGDVTFYNSSGSETVRITNDGKVGIGISTPTSELHVIGKANITGNITSPKYCIGIDCISDWDDVNVTPDLSSYLQNGTEANFSGLVVGNTSGGIITDIKDEDNMASDSQTALATQQSIKAYFDDNTVSLQRIHLKKSSAIEDINSPEVSIKWDAEEFKDAGTYTHDTGSDPEKITVLSSGVYRIFWTLGIDNTGSNRIVGMSYIKKNGVTIDSTKVMAYGRGTNYGDESVMTGITTISLSANDYIELWANTDFDQQSNAVNTVVSTSEFIIEKLATEADSNTWRPIYDAPVDGVTTESISSNWAYGHLNDNPDIHIDWTDASDNFSTTGNVTADYFIGDGSQLTDLTESQISDLQTYAINNTAGWILNFTEISSDDWTNITITESQISNLVHTVNGIDINVLDINASSATIHGDLNVTGTSYLGEVTLTSDNITVNNILPKTGGDIDVIGNLDVNGSVNVSGSVYVPEISNAAGLLKIQPDVQGDVELFGDTRVANNENSKIFKVWRRSSGGNDYIRFYISSSKKAFIHASSELTLQAQQPFTINSVTDDITFKVGDNAGAKKFYFQDSDNNNVATIDSDGETYFAGNVGIGTTNPTQALDVAGGIKLGDVVTAESGVIRWTGTAYQGYNGSSWNSFATTAGSVWIQDGTDIYYTSGNVGIGTTSPTQVLDVNGSVNVSGTVYANNISSSSPLQLQTSGTTRIYIDDSNGNVGIGTTSPTQALDVNGSVNITGDLIVDTDTLFVDSDNNGVGIGTSNPSSALAVSSDTEPQFTIAHKTSPEHNLTISHRGVFDVTISNYFRFQSGGSDQMVIDQNGNVGIGTPSPDSPLHVFSDTEALLQLSRNSDTQDGTVVAGLLFGVGTDPSLQQKAAILLRRTASSGRGDLVFSVDNEANNEDASLEDVVMVIQRDGNVGIGDISPGSKLAVSGGATIGASYDTTAAPSDGLIVEGNVGIGTSSPDNQLNIGKSNGAKILLSREDGGTQTDNLLGQILFDSTDGGVSSTDASAMIRAYAAEDHGSGDKGGYLTFETKANDNDEDQSATEHLRIRDNGDIVVGQSNNDDSALVFSPSSQGYGVDSELRIQSRGGNDPAFMIMRNAEYDGNNYQYIDDGGKTATMIEFTNNGGIAYRYAESGTGQISSWDTMFYAQGGVNQRVGIGTDNPEKGLHVVYNDRQLRLGVDDLALYSEIYTATDGDFIIYVADPTNNANPRWAQYDGDSSWDFTSDARLKRGIVNAEPFLDRIMKLKVRRFNWKGEPDRELKELGLVAQEVQPYFPEIVGEIDEAELGGKTLTLGYTTFGVIALKGVQEVNQKVDDLVGGNYTVKTKAVFDEDSVGTATILINETFVEVEFGEEYEVLPIITATPIGLPNFFYGVDEINTTGFKILISEAQNKEVVFNWHAFGQSSLVVNETKKDEDIIEINKTLLNETVVVPENETIEVNITVPEDNISINETPTNETTEINETVVVPENETIDINETIPVNDTVPINETPEEEETPRINDTIPDEVNQTTPDDYNETSNVTIPINDAEEVIEVNTTIPEEINQTIPDNETEEIDFVIYASTEIVNDSVDNTLKEVNETPEESPEIQDMNLTAEELELLNS